MKLKIKRIFKGDKYTIGHLYINNIYFCDTLEDKVRNLPKEPKVYGETAIPAGTYEIDMNTVSPKFKNRSWAKKWGGIVPRLKNVPYFEGVLIHPFNRPEESYGCVGIGENSKPGMVLNSVRYFQILMEKYLYPAKKRKE
jgi:hypothetical protein